MKRKKSHGEEHENTEAWLLPYSDLMTLLLAMFIVLFAVSKIDATKAQAISRAFQSVFGMPSGEMPIEGGKGVMPDSSEELNIFQEVLNQSPSNQEAMYKQEMDHLNTIKDDLTKYFKEEGLGLDVEMYINERGLVISLNNAILFDPGRVDIKPEIERILSKIGNTLKILDNYISVEGHTDKMPISSAIYPSNWELSAARAARVVRLFVDECDILPEKLTAVGYGEFRPLGSNDTPEGRTKNRRVEVIVMSSKLPN